MAVRPGQGSSPSLGLGEGYAKAANDSLLRSSKRKRSLVTRRAFLQAGSFSPVFFSLASLSARAVSTGIAKPTDIRIDEFSVDYQEFPYRTPYKFGGREIDRVTVLNGHCAVHTVSGRSARGFGSMPLVSAWAFPSAKMSFDAALGAMKTLAERIRHTLRPNQTRACAAG